MDHARSERIDASALFAPFALNNWVLPNRFVLPAMQRGWCRGGAPTQELEDYYKRRVEGGVGLVISESVAVDHVGASQKDSCARMNDRTVAEWAQCIAGVRSAGGHMLVQLWHEGAMRPEGGDGPYAAFPTLSPSGYASSDRKAGGAASQEDLAEIKAAFVRSALLAQQAGANGVEIHAAHGFLLDQFLWRETNRRADGYGGDDVLDRVRFPAEIVAEIRAACGPGFIVSFRFSQWKEVDFGARVVETPADLGRMLNALRDAGVSAIHASTRRFWQPEWPDSDLTLAGWCKHLCDLPVITVGSVGLDVAVMDGDPDRVPTAKAREAIEDLVRRFERNEFDLVSVGRSQIGDPNWIGKVRAGRYETIRTFQRSDIQKLDSELAELARSSGRIGSSST